MRGIAIHPLGPDTIYAGGTVGLFKSVDAGNSWSFVHLPLYPHNEITSVLIHPTQQGLILCGGPVNQWISKDGGESWDTLAVPHYNGVSDLEIDPNNDDILYLVSNGFFAGKGVWKSIDRGETWFSIQNNIVSEDGGGIDIEVDYRNGDVLYLSAFDTSYACLYKSENGGESWRNIRPEGITGMPCINKVAINPGDPYSIFIASREDGVFRSIDDGNSWTPMDSGLNVLELPTMEIDIQNQILYLGTYHDGIYKSLNNGEEWLKISSNVNAVECIDVFVSASDKIWVTARNGLFQSDDWGETWQLIETGIPIINFPCGIKTDKYNPDRIYVSSAISAWKSDMAMPAGFYISEDGGSTWDFYNTGLPNDISYLYFDIAYINEQDRRIFLAGYDGLYKSDDIGQTWSKIIDDMYCCVVKAAPSDPDIIAVSDYDNGVFLSSDGGDTWQQTSELPYHRYSYVTDIAFDPSDANHIYASSYYIGLYESTDSGESWSCINNDIPFDTDMGVITSILINPENTDNIFAATNFYGIYQTHNGGQNWEPFNAGIDTADGSGYLSFAADDTTRLCFASMRKSAWTITRTATGIEQNEIALPLSVNLSAYPNPFNAATRITFNINAAANVKADIYDVLGRHVANIVNEYLYPGYHSVVWKPETVSTGQYYIRLDDGNAIGTQKMMYIK